MNEYLQNVYDSVFDLVYQSTLDRKAHDPSFTKDQLQELLQTYYVNIDNNWEGRGEIKETELAATVAAYEVVLANWDEKPA